MTVEDVQGRCPCYRPGDRIVLGNGVRSDLRQTTACCMHRRAAIVPFYCALAEWVKPRQMGLAAKGDPDGSKARVQSADPCEHTGAAQCS